MKQHTEYTTPLVDVVINALQDKKGHDVTVVDLHGIDDTICQYFVIATGGSPAQVHAMAMSVGEQARERLSQRPVAVDGLRQSLWVAMDYCDVMVHIFQEAERDFYDLEHLWADAEITRIPDLD